MELGWSPMPDFRAGLDKTAEWYLSNGKWLERVISGDYVKYYDNQYSGR
jgi:dTDP-glucose 4,6-dehydratase